VSTRILLHFRKSAHSPLKAANLNVIRLIGSVRFQQENGWSDAFRAIIDTGSPVSVIPEYIWQRIQRSPFDAPQHHIGLAGRQLPVDLATVRCAAVDEANVSPPFSMRAYLSHGDSDFLLLGMADFVTRSLLHCDYQKGEAYLEFP